MLDDVERRTGVLPAVLLADGGHAKHECIRSATERGVEVLIPLPARANKPDAKDDPAIAAWHERMATDEAKQKYRARPGLCELPNAHLKCHHGMAQMLVRGIEKVTCVVLLGVLTGNLLAHASALLA